MTQHYHPSLTRWGITYDMGLYVDRENAHRALLDNGPDDEEGVRIRMNPCHNLDCEARVRTEPFPWQS